MDNMIYGAPGDTNLQNWHYLQLPVRHFIIKDSASVGSLVSVYYTLLNYMGWIPVLGGLRYNLHCYKQMQTNGTQILAYQFCITEVAEKKCVNLSSCLVVS